MSTFNKHFQDNANLFTIQCEQTTGIWYTVNGAENFEVTRQWLSGFKFECRDLQKGKLCLKTKNIFHEEIFYSVN